MTFCLRQSQSLEGNGTLQVSEAEASQEASMASLLELHQLCLDQQAHLARYPVGVSEACATSQCTTPQSQRRRSRIEDCSPTMCSSRAGLSAPPSPKSHACEASTSGANGSRTPANDAMQSQAAAHPPSPDRSTHADRTFAGLQSATASSASKSRHSNGGYTGRATASSSHAAKQHHAHHGAASAATDSRKTASQGDSALQEKSHAQPQACQIQRSDEHSALSSKPDEYHPNKPQDVVEHDMDENSAPGALLSTKHSPDRSRVKSMLSKPLKQQMRRQCHTAPPKAQRSSTLQESNLRIRPCLIPLASKMPSHAAGNASGLKLESEALPLQEVQVSGEVDTPQQARTSHHATQAKAHPGEAASAPVSVALSDHLAELHEAKATAEAHGLKVPAAALTCAHSQPQPGPGLLSKPAAALYAKSLACCGQKGTSKGFKSRPNCKRHSRMHGKQRVQILLRNVRDKGNVTCERQQNHLKAKSLACSAHPIKMDQPPAWFGSRVAVAAVPDGGTSLDEGPEAAAMVTAAATVSHSSSAIVNGAPAETALPEACNTPWPSHTSDRVAHGPTGALLKAASQDRPDSPSPALPALRERTMLTADDKGPRMASATQALQHDIQRLLWSVMQQESRLLWSCLSSASSSCRSQAQAEGSLSQHPYWGADHGAASAQDGSAIHHDRGQMQAPALCPHEVMTTSQIQCSTTGQRLQHEDDEPSGCSQGAKSTYAAADGSIPFSIIWKAQGTNAAVESLHDDLVVVEACQPLGSLQQASMMSSKDGKVDSSAPADDSEQQQLVSTLRIQLDAERQKDATLGQEKPNLELQQQTLLQQQLADQSSAENCQSASETLKLSHQLQTCQQELDLQQDELKEGKQVIQELRQRLAMQHAEHEMAIQQTHQFSNRHLTGKIEQLERKLAEDKQATQELGQTLSRQQAQHECAVKQWQKESLQHEEELKAKLECEQAQNKGALQDLQAKHSSLLQHKVWEAAWLESQLSTSQEHNAGLQKQLDILLADKQRLAQQEETCKKLLEEQSANERKQLHKLKSMRQKAQKLEAQTAAAEGTLGETRAAVRKLQDLGQLHAKQALSDLQKLCRLIGRHAQLVRVAVQSSMIID